MYPHSDPLNPNPLDSGFPDPNPLDCGSPDSDPLDSDPLDDVGAPPPMPVKIVVSGGFGVGKTTLIGSLSEIEPLTTEAAMTTAAADLDDGQAALLRELERRGGDVWHAYPLKEASRAIDAGDPTPEHADELTDR